MHNLIDLNSHFTIMGLMRTAVIGGMVGKHSAKKQMEGMQKQAQQAQQKSKRTIPSVHGDTIQYIYSDAAHTNPLCRVTPVDLIREGHDYDKVKCS